MLKFVKHNMESIDGVDIFPIISLVIFFTIFVAYLVYALTFSKDKIEILSQLPLKEN